MDKGQTIAFELLHDEPFAAKESDREFLLERDTDLDATSRGQEAVFLTDQAAAKLAQVDRDDLAGKGGGKRKLLTRGGRVGVHRDEQ